MSDHPETSDGVPSPRPQPAPTPVEPRGAAARPVEVGGRGPRSSGGLEPTRYGDWEKDGRCIDF